MKIKITKDDLLWFAIIGLLAVIVGVVALDKLLRIATPGQGL